MDNILTSTLYDQINEGNKGDGNFKTQAYQAVVDKLRLEGILVTVDHVKHRTKIWKKHYGVITDIKNFTKFKWDEEKKMLVIPVEDLAEWKSYCEVIVLLCYFYSCHLLAFLILFLFFPSISNYEVKSFSWFPIFTVVGIGELNTFLSLIQVQHLSLTSFQ